MKTLYYLRHSLKNGDNHITREGETLARKQGEVYRNISFAQIFHGELPRTRETAEALHCGLGRQAVNIPVVGPIAGIGSDIIFGEMITEEFRKAVKSGLNNFIALRRAHPTNTVGKWTAISWSALLTMFNLMEDGTVAIAVGHSPMIELAAWMCNDYNLIDRFREIKETEGFVFYCNDESIRLGYKVFAPNC